MSDLLSIGASGVRAYQTALGTVSENIANAGNAGYARRSATLSEIGGGVSPLTSRTVAVGNGVTVGGIARSADAYRSADVRAAGADLARTDTAIDWLQRIDAALTGSALDDRLTGFFNAAKAIAADPTADAPRSAMLEAAKGAATAFRATGRALDQAMADLDSTAGNAVRQLNTLGAALAKVNDGLGRVQPGSAGAAQLQDQRDQLLEQMSAISDVSVTTDATGRASVRLGGQNGPVFVAGSGAGSVGYARNADGAVAYSVQRGDGVSALTPSGGALAGIADAAGRIAGALKAVDKLASDFVDGVNAVQAQGRDLAGNPGAAMFATGDAPTEIDVALTDPDGIAAASPGGGTRDNGNIAKLSALRASGGFEAKVTALVSDNAATIASRQTVATAQGAIHDAAVTARDQASGTNLDSEAVDLLRFQQAYSASSRVIQVARETLQSILDIH